LPFAPRFLKMATGAMGAAGASPGVVSVSAIVFLGSVFGCEWCGGVAVRGRRKFEMGSSKEYWAMS
jgi:hypothetical protein